MPRYHNLALCTKHAHVLQSGCKFIEAAKRLKTSASPHHTVKCEDPSCMKSCLLLSTGAFNIHLCSQIVNPLSRIESGMNLHPDHMKQSANLFLWAVRNHFSEGNLSGITFAVRLGIDSPLSNHEQHMYSLHILWRCVQLNVQAKI